MTACYWCPLMSPACPGCKHQPEPIEGQGDLLEELDQ